jgi:hypothetical protein
MTMEPFPSLELDNGKWVGEVSLPFWEGAADCSGPYGSLASTAPSDGIAGLLVFGPERPSEELPTTAQAKAFRFLMENEQAIGRAIQERFCSYYDELREGIALDGHDPEQYLPRLKWDGEIRQSIGIACCYVLHESREGMSFVGFLFGCEWDEEHGLGVLTHGLNLLDIGGADIAFNAYDD